MFINFSNHPSANWEAKQLEAASVYGTVVDIPFPAIPPEADNEALRLLSDTYYQHIEKLLHTAKESSVIHLTGEPTFSFILVKRLLQNGYKVVASTSYRQTIEIGNQKTSVFHFIQFRAYQL